MAWHWYDVEAFQARKLHPETRAVLAGRTRSATLRAKREAIRTARRLARQGRVGSRAAVYLVRHRAPSDPGYSVEAGTENRPVRVLIYQCVKRPGDAHATGEEL